MPKRGDWVALNSKGIAKWPNLKGNYRIEKTFKGGYVICVPRDSKPFVLNDEVKEGVRDYCDRFE